jgi:hypothetical protein
VWGRWLLRHIPFRWGRPYSVMGDDHGRRMSATVPFRLKVNIGESENRRIPIVWYYTPRLMNAFSSQISEEMGCRSIEHSMSIAHRPRVRSWLAQKYAPERFPSIEGISSSTGSKPSEDKPPWKGPEKPCPNLRDYTSAEHHRGSASDGHTTKCPRTIRSRKSRADVPPRGKCNLPQYFVGERISNDELLRASAQTCHPIADRWDRNPIRFPGPFLAHALGASPFSTWKERKAI